MPWLGFEACNISWGRRGAVVKILIADREKR